MPASGEDQRALIARLRVVIEAKDAMLRSELEVTREQFRRVELRVAELERPAGAGQLEFWYPAVEGLDRNRERRKAERVREWQSSERERRKDRKRGGRPGHPGAGLSRDPDSDERREVPPPAKCSRCGARLEDAERAGTWWSQVGDVKIARFVAGCHLASQPARTPHPACLCRRRAEVAGVAHRARRGCAGCGPGTCGLVGGRPAGPRPGVLHHAAPRPSSFYRYCAAHDLVDRIPTAGWRGRWWTRITPLRWA